MTVNLTDHTIGICGAGQMGKAMAVCFRRAGFRTLVWMRNTQKVAGVEQEMAQLDAWLQTHVGPAPKTEVKLKLVTDLSAIDAVADVVVDCIAEVMAEKARLFGDLPLARERQATFLTTTSGLSITELGRASGTARTLVGTHFWNPPHLMPLVEVIRGADSDPDVVERVVKLVLAIGKIPVRVERDVPGFIGNRLLHALWREAIYLVQQGIASAEDVDRVARLTFGLRLPAIGPLENMDLVGLDLVRTIQDYLLADLSAARQPLPLLDEQVKKNELGMKTGRGFYDWHTRSPEECLERRDLQIVNQLRYLRETNNL